MSERTVRLVKHEAKKRKRSGQAHSYMAALAQLAAENGHGDWAAYEKVLLAVPDAAPDFRIRLVPAAGEAKMIGVFMRDILPYHGLDESQWQAAADEERVQFVLDFALWSRRKRGDFTGYRAEITESNVEHGVEAAGPAPAQGHQAPSSAPDFVVEVESRATGKKEHIGVQLADLLELHGMSQAEWDEAGHEEQESLVEEAALWEKRSKGDLGGYYAEVLSGLDQGEGSAPR
ncbi:hypothetical protein ACFPOU_07790 [Massilia jejuensis]|uniref:Uncharacterized protein n=1 Tax=Massilia jejuensis TaxID=648894 RepID=A0ABW0PEC9_9BURK